MVQVVGHRVQWNADRRLWYCDIELDPGATYMPFIRLAFVRYQPNALAGAKISKVVLGDFAQVLPRRRSTFKRTGAQLTFALHGTVPDHGPMLFPAGWPTDSPYLDISPIPLPGTTVETGRNKIELVLQTRDPALDTDLAWSDVQVLASSLLAPASTVIGPVLPGGVITPQFDLTSAKGLPTAKDPTSASNWRRSILAVVDRYADDRHHYDRWRGYRHTARSHDLADDDHVTSRERQTCTSGRPRIRAVLHGPLDPPGDRRLHAQTPRRRGAARLHGVLQFVVGLDPRSPAAVTRPAARDRTWPAHSRFLRPAIHLPTTRRCKSSHSLRACSYHRRASCQRSLTS